jgi:hypothetical protein
MGITSGKAANASTANAEIFSQDTDGTPIAFYVTRVESRQNIIMLIQERGGEVLERVVPADPDLRIVCVVSDRLQTPLTLPQGMLVVTRQFIIDCVESNSLLPYEKYAPVEQCDILATAPTTPAGRNAYTDMEDRALLDAVRDAVDMGYAEEGLKLYKIIAPQFPRHTTQSLRDRYLKQLLPRQQSRLLSSPFKPGNDIKEIQSDPCMPKMSKLSHPLDNDLSSPNKVAKTDQLDAAERRSKAHTPQPVFQPYTQVLTDDVQQMKEVEENVPESSDLIEVKIDEVGQISSQTLLTLEDGKNDTNKPIRDTVKWMMDSSRQPFEVVLFALYQCNGLVNDAMRFLTDPSMSIKWQSEEDLCLLGERDRNKIDAIIGEHGANAVRERQSFLKELCAPI